MADWPAPASSPVRPALVVVLANGIALKLRPDVVAADVDGAAAPAAGVADDCMDPN